MLGNAENGWQNTGASRSRFGNTVGFKMSAWWSWEVDNDVVGDGDTLESSGSLISSRNTLLEG
jgi:hypothetical protein